MIDNGIRNTGVSVNWKWLDKNGGRGEQSLAIIRIYL